MNTRLLLLTLLSLLSACYYDRGYYSTTGPSVYGGNPRVGSVCDPNASYDQCANAGLSCTPTLVDGGFFCEYPGEFYPCDPSVGCAANLSCLGGFCLQDCATTDDCWDPLTVCGEFAGGSECLLDQCQARDGFGLWQSCAAADANGNDGTCVPLEATAGDNGCQQGGSVPLGGVCQFYREAGGPGFCAVGLMCMVDTLGDNRGVCLQACDAFHGGGPSCPTGTSCVVTTLPLPPPQVSALDYFSDTGACAQSCTPGLTADAGADAGMVEDGGDAGDELADGGELDGGVVPDAGGAVSGGCPAPLSCLNGSINVVPEYVCLP